MPENLDGYTTPEDLSAKLGQLDILEILHPTAIDLTQSLLSAAASVDQSLTVRDLLNHDLNPNKPSENGKDTPLGLAAAGGFLPVVRPLLDNKADINLANGDRKSPLYLAVENDRREVAQVLLDYDNQPQDSNSSSSSSRCEDEHEASHFNHIIVDAPDIVRLTPSQGNTHFASLLIKFGANVNAKICCTQNPSASGGRE